jgi:hypothetical protein
LKKEENGDDKVQNAETDKKSDASMESNGVADDKIVPKTDKTAKEEADESLEKS